MQEKDITIKIGKWLRHNLFESAAVEVKICKEKSLPFSRLEEHQKNALMVAAESTLVFKIPDAGYQNPFDLFALHKVGAFVAVAFYERGCDKFYMIHIFDWVAEEEKGERKSLTQERAAAIGRVCYLSKNPPKEA